MGNNTPRSHSHRCTCLSDFQVGRGSPTFLGRRDSNDIVLSLGIGVG